ncbi:glycosyltransferase [Antarcticibacterium sp. 1MA-6-2]|uniref:glycosyltransferase n=1 Tax=Antarcticibacterium sp. 1MA-6-2 TaxID=2908210 RepID=UPI002882E67D|nr:glycosyltransferase [Antarcticibacterium sp. 1MA-6-2]
MKDIILAEGFAGIEKIKVLGKGSSNGIDLKYFNSKKQENCEREILLEKLRIPENDLIFIFIGRLVSEKGINELVAAFDELQQTFKDISLLLVGPFEEELDPLTPTTLQTINEHTKIFFTGYQPDVRPYLEISHILTFPSYREGFPNVVMQAGAMGLPSIVSNINGCNEIIETGKNGIIIPVKDKNALFESMKTLIKNPSLRLELASKARAEIRENYDREQFWLLLKEEYEGLIKELNLHS